MQGDLDSWLDTASGSDEEFVDRVWRVVVRREPEPEGRERALAKLGDGTLSRAGLLRELVASEEFAAVALFDDALAFAAGERARPRDGGGPWRPRLLHAPAAADERALEIPWALARYDGERRVLDVGYAFAEPAYLAGLTALGAAELTGVDLAEAEVPGLDSVVADVRDLPFADSSFDLVYCISTLEHVGRDNEVYDVDAAREQQGDEAALRELRRVLANDGRLLVSVPTGEHDDQGWQLPQVESPGCEGLHDGSLRRRGPAPAPRDRARAGARRAGRRGRRQPRRARARARRRRRDSRLHRDRCGGRCGPRALRRGRDDG